MAFIDDSKFVVSQIRHSCVTSDDTGMSEIVIVNEEMENEKLLQRKKFGNWGNAEHFGNYSNSFDIDVSPITNSGDFPTQPIIEAKTSSRGPETKCKNIPWKDPKNGDVDFTDAFHKKEVQQHHGKQDRKSHASLLSKMVEKSLNQPTNPFASYGKFDGEGYAKSNKVRVFRIFFPSSKGHAPQPAMNVALLVNGAQVQDLVGLIMCKYTQQGRKPDLKEDVKLYCLLIADEQDGEIDFDLPALDSKELISKFDFKALALSSTKTEEEEEEVVVQPKVKNGIIVEVCEEKQGSSKFTVDRLDLCMKVVMEKMLKKRNLKRTGREYVLVKKNDPENAINLEDTLESMGTLEFRLVKKSSIHSTKKDIDKNGKGIPDFFTSSQYKSFKVSMLHRFGPATDVQLGIHKSTIEIQQSTQSGQRTFLSRSPKAVTIEMDFVVNAEVMKTGSNRSVFRIIYSNGTSFKNYDFESAQDMATEIVHKIELILESSPRSESRIEYQKTKAKDKRGKKS